MMVYNMDFFLFFFSGVAADREFGFALDHSSSK